MVLKAKFLCLATFLTLLAGPVLSMEDEFNPDSTYRKYGPTYVGTLITTPDIDKAMTNAVHGRNANGIHIIDIRKQFEKIQQEARDLIRNMPAYVAFEEFQGTLDYVSPLSLRGQLKGYGNWVSNLGDEASSEKKEEDVHSLKSVLPDFRGDDEDSL